MLRIPPAIGASLWAWANRKPSSRSDYADRKELRRWLVWTCLAAVIVLLVSLAAGNHERYSHPFNVFDEGAHYDYALALSHGHIPRSGAQLSQQTLRDLSCVGGFGLPAHGCQTEQRNPADLPADGYSYEAVQQPPLGYLPYLVTVRASSSPHSGLVVARWGGFIWAVIAAGLLVWVGWLGDLSTLEVITVLAIGILSPVEVYAAAAVTNDSSAVAAGALVLGTALLARRRGKPTALAGLIVGIIVGFMKGLFVVAPFAVLIALVVADISKRRRPTRADFWTRYGCTLMMFVGSVASYAAWLVIQDARAIVPPSVVLHALQGFSTTPYLRPSTILTGVQDGLSGLIAYAPAPLYWIWNLTVYGSLAGVLVLQGTPTRTQVRALAAGVFAGIVALSVAFPLLNFIEGHYNFAMPARYALPLLPIAGFAVARALRTRGLLLVGVVLPALAVIDQVSTGQF